MKTAEIKLIEFFREPMQMIVTGSEGYHWTQEQCQKLWDDIVRAGRDNRVSGHFIGTMIYVEHGILSTTPVPRYLLIDGQQRLATLSLIVLALEGANDRQEDSSSKEIHDLLLSNPQGRGGLRHRLVLLGEEQDVFLSIARGEPTAAGIPSNLADNFIFLKGLIEKSGVDPKLVYRGISKLTFIPISTDRYYENPQFIHESIENTGLDADQKSLIRNWLGLLSPS